MSSICCLLKRPWCSKSGIYWKIADFLLSTGLGTLNLLSTEDRLVLFIFYLLKIVRYHLLSNEGSLALSICYLAWYSQSAINWKLLGILNLLSTENCLIFSICYLLKIAWYSQSAKVGIPSYLEYNCYTQDNLVFLLCYLLKTIWYSQSAFYSWYFGIQNLLSTEESLIF